MFDSFFSGPYAESHIALLITPFVIGIYLWLTAKKSEESGDSGDGERNSSGSGENPTSPSDGIQDTRGQKRRTRS